MLKSIFPLFPLALLLGYIKLQQRQGKGNYSLKSRKGKLHFVILMFLALFLFVTLIWYAFAEGETANQQRSLLLIAISGPAAALTGMTAAYILKKHDRNKIKHSMKKTNPGKHKII